MGTITVEGPDGNVVTVEIKGDVPTPEEGAAIATGLTPEPPGIPAPLLGKPAVESIGEGRTGLIPEQIRTGIRETVKEMPGLLEFGVEMTPSVAGAVAGGAAGLAIGGPAAPITGLIGAIGGGLLGEFGAQEIGIAPESDVALGLSAAGPVFGKVLGATARGTLKASAFAASKLPPVKAALGKVIAEKVVPEFKRIGTTIIESQRGLMKFPTDRLYAAARKAGVRVPAIEFRPVFSAFNELITELKVFSAFPEAQQALNLIARAMETLAPTGRALGKKASADIGIAIDTIIAAHQMVGAAVAKAQSAGGLRLGSAKKVFKELANVLDKVAAGKGPAKRGAQLAKAAIARAKLGFAVRDFERAVADFSKIRPGEDVVTMQINKLQNWLTKVTDPKSSIYKKNFTEALKKELPAIKERLLELGKLVGTGSAAGPGSIVVRGIGANTGRALSALVFGLGGFGTGGFVGAAVGGMIGASMPEMMVAILTSKTGFKALQKVLAGGQREISAKTWFAIGELVTRGPEFKASRKEREEAFSELEAKDEFEFQPQGQSIFPEGQAPEGLLQLLGIEAEASEIEGGEGEEKVIEGGEGDNIEGGTAQAKEGVDLTTLQPEAQSGVETAQTVFAEFGLEALVTSTGPEDRKSVKSVEGSKHETGQAFDLRISSIPKSKLKEVVAALAASLGDDYDVALEKDHIHVEFDPKGSE